MKNKGDGPPPQKIGTDLWTPKLRADFQEGDEDSNFSVLRIWPFTEWPRPLH